ncbi:Dabb family protein [Pseudoroseicyclus tamaricis]|uniref:Dabb family protein n=1 Tax=Pseudoroseicyclus tamaricis TaxID=2705421 RepID=A0A6B2JKT2_9RHOB|nr:Dabb family protein [Pseudoroseicyclus tamaricis]NDV02113.1 Dabb family protein [Pseudoroseicyclus tamaricis]
MIRHVVLLRLQPGHDAGELGEVMAGLAGLSLEGLTGFDHGPNLDMEGKSPGYSYGFVVTFADRAALARYAADPGHQALGARLVALCGGAEGIFVADLES